MIPIRSLIWFVLVFVFATFAGQIPVGDKTIANHVEVLVHKIGETKQVKEARQEINRQVPATINRVRRKLAEWISPDHDKPMPAAAKAAAEFFDQ